MGYKGYMGYVGYIYMGLLRYASSLCVSVFGLFLDENESKAKDKVFNIFGSVGCCFWNNNLQIFFGDYVFIPCNVITNFFYFFSLSFSLTVFDFSF